MILINVEIIDSITNEINHSLTFTEYCSLMPTLNNQINGNIKLDLNNNGCDSSYLPMSSLMIVSNNGTGNFYNVYTNCGRTIKYKDLKVSLLSVNIYILYS